MDSSKSEQEQSQDDSPRANDQQKGRLNRFGGGVTHRLPPLLASKVEPIRSAYLQPLIENVDRLLWHEESRNLFQRYFNEFCGMVESHIRELQKYEEITKVNLDRLPEEDGPAKTILVEMQNAQPLTLTEKIRLWHEIVQRYNSLHKKPPQDHPDWILRGFYGYIQRDQLVNGLFVWHPPLNEMPVNPLLWFYPEMGKYLFHNDLGRQPAEDEKQMCDFVRLAVIYDESCAYQTSIMVYKHVEYEGSFLRNDFTKDLWESYKTPKDKSFEETQRRTLQHALENVKACLGECLPESEPQGKAGQGEMATKQAMPKSANANAKPVRDQVFICYSRKDKKWLDELQTHLRPYRSVTTWSDEKITPGAEWFVKIKESLARTKVGVLLVTPDFLASDFIREHELTPLLKEAEKGRVCIIWIPLRACSYEQTPLKDYQAAIDPKKPLANMKAERDKAWVEICKEIKKAVGRTPPAKAS